MGLVIPWSVLCDLPPGGVALRGDIGAMNLLRVVNKEPHMRRTLMHLHVRPDEWLDEVTGRHRPSLVIPCG
eukprot:12916143-Prorocentrum_lima.AAC.1